MAQITSTPLKLEQARIIAKDYNTKINKKVDAEDGKGLYPDADKEKLSGIEANAQKNNITKVQVNGTDQTISDDGTLNLDVEAVITGDNLVSDDDLTQKLNDYTKTSDLADDPGLTDKFLDKETAQSTYANKNDIPKVQIPTCTQEELEGKKATAVDGDRVVVTDEEYHIYIYVGETGTGEWKDTGTHVNLSDYVQKDGNKVLVDPDTVAQVDTNKQSIESLQGTVDGKLSESDIVFATDPEVEAQLALGAQDAQSPAA